MTTENTSTSLLKKKKLTPQKLEQDRDGLVHQVTAEVEALAKQYKFDPWKVELAKELARPKALRMSQTDLAKKFDTSINTIRYWQTHPVMLKMRMDLVKIHFFNDVSDVLMAIRDEALRGDVPAARLFFEMIGELKAYDDANMPRPAYFNKDEVDIYLIRIRRKHNMPLPDYLQKVVDTKPELLKEVE